MRFYSKALPCADDIVFVTVHSFSDNGAYCKLLEYDGMEGMIQITEIARNRKDSKIVQKVFEIGKIYPAQVLKADSKFVELSYRRVDITIRTKLVTNFAYVKKIIALATELIFLTGLSEQFVYERIVWPTFLRYDKGADTSSIQFNEIEDMYNYILEKPECFVEKIMKTHAAEATVFVSSMKDRIKTSDTVLTKNFELMVLDPGSIDKLKYILSHSIDPMIEIKYVSSPRYQIVASGQDIDMIEQSINHTISTLRENCADFKTKLTFSKETVSLKKKEFYLKALNMGLYQNE